MPDVRRILADIERRGVAVDTWEVRSPTLDDVFLTLTGRPTEPAARPRRLPGVLMTTLTAPRRPPSAGASTTPPPSSAGACAGRCASSTPSCMAVILPVILLLMFVYVFGGAIETGGTTSTGSCPGIILLTAGYGSANTAVDVASDMTGGIIDRFRSLPIRPTGVLTGHVVASMVRNAVSTALVHRHRVPHRVRRRRVAAASGSRRIGLIALFVLALTWMAVAIGVVASGPEAASGFTFAILFLPYVSSAFVPPESMPSVLENDRDVQPDHAVTDTLRGLLLGHAGRRLVGRGGRCGASGSSSSGASRPGVLFRRSR